MSNLPKPANEQERLERLESYEILDTATEAQFDDLTTLAAQIMDVPICLISLVDENRQWFKSKYGLDADETSREISFCQYAIMDEEVFEVEDAQVDERFMENPLVTGQPNIRFYAGAPLTDDDGLNLGTFCVIDRKPKILNQEQKESLKSIARTALRIIKLRKANLDQNKFVKFFDLTLDMLCIGKTDGYARYLNPAFTRVLGWSEDELRSKPLIEFVHPDDVPVTMEELSKLAKGERIVGFKNRFIKKDGGLCWLHWTCQPDMNTGELFAAAHDVTELHNIQVSLREAKDIAEQSSSAKDIFLSNVSHEIRTPLNAIIGFTDLLQQTNLNELQSQYLDTVSVASKNLIVLINDVLDVSKIESGELSLEQRPFSIKKLIEDVINLQTHSAKSKGLKLLSVIDHEIPEYVLGDYNRLMQILINLVNNAIKFTDKGHVEVKAMLQQADDKEASILFTIKDTGIGIDQNKLDDIFERFTQAENSGTRKYGGTGLGLNIAKMLVELHKGKISVSSELNKGSEFSVEMTYPIAEFDAVENEVGNVEKEVNGVLEGVKILLVEDNEHNHILATTYIEKHKGLVDLAINGKEAVDKMEHHQYDLILMDLQMPEMDGFEATEIIRERFSKDIPIVACSAHSLVGEKWKCLEIGMNDYIAKPYNEGELINTIRDYTKKGKKGLPRDRELVEEVAINHTDPDAYKSILSDLEDEAGSEFIDDMLEIFHKRTPKDIEEFELALAQGQLDVILRKAHLISGSLGGLRFYYGNNIARETVNAAKEGDTEKTKRLTIDLISYLRDALQETHEYMDQR